MLYRKRNAGIRKLKSPAIHTAPPGPAARPAGFGHASLAAADRFLASLGLLAGDPLVNPTDEWQKSEN